ncbi:porin family protein [Mangrovimonas xylaniphaga]|uniref:porin family protein n=1 Tax=Mangrovimonas xylaniphaga TaxID=1645915 RepID=UPI0006B697D2|nr:porin family protein [Mangrovimonas xylaniphaga]
MKTIFTSLLVVLFVTLGYSQEVKYGVRAGLTISNLDYKETPIVRNPHRNGFLFGVHADIGLTEQFSIMPELQFSPEGAGVEDFANDYLNLPVLFKYAMFDGRVALGVGPQAGLKIHKEGDGFKNFVFSGVGIIEFKVCEDWYVDARYNYGFSNVFDDDLSPEATNNVIQIGVNFRVF